MGAGETMQRLMFRAVSAIHVGVLRATKGRMGSRMGEGRIVVLTTTGARSRAKRSTALMSVRDGDDYVVIASNGGMRRNPGWYHNIRAHPEARIEVEGRAMDVHGHVATPEERARLWPDIVARFPNYGGYQEKTAREIPLVILEPAAPPQA
jgi:deazaflavin-dependent oxidoreductase (nitroreductase family)